MRSIRNMLILIVILAPVAIGQVSGTRLASLRGIWCRKPFVEHLQQTRSPSAEYHKTIEYVKIFPELDSVSRYWGFTVPTLSVYSERLSVAESTITLIGTDSSTDQIYSYHGFDSILSPVNFGRNDCCHLLKISDDPYTDLGILINRTVIAGRYINNSERSDTVTFSESGLLGGIAGYQRYYIVTDYSRSKFGDITIDPDTSVYDTIILEDTLRSRYLWLAFRLGVDGISLYEPFGDSVRYFPKRIFERTWPPSFEQKDSGYRDLAMLYSYPNPAYQFAEHRDGRIPNYPVVRYGILFHRGRVPQFDSSTMVYELISIK